ncbi:hypothetical protein Bbelb_052840 [Branchiostoma belcheri]|nr:hypothetical protein Bbelb_052840 [Branchiostoma belcheri]
MGNCCTEHVRPAHGGCAFRAYTCTPQNTCAPYQVLLTYNARETHLISTVYKDDLTDDCQPVSKMRSKKAQKKASAAATTRQGPKKRPGEDDRRREEESDGS